MGARDIAHESRKNWNTSESIISRDVQTFFRHEGWMSQERRRLIYGDNMNLIGRSRSYYLIVARALRPLIRLLLELWGNSFLPKMFISSVFFCLKNAGEY